MSDIRSNVSKKNPYWIPKHRYLELKHYCLQYGDWKRQLNRIHSSIASPAFIDGFAKASGHSDPTEKLAIIASALADNIALVDRVAYEAGGDLGYWLGIGVTEGLSYEALKTRADIPCCREVYYNLYRKFFWLLDKYRT